MDRSVLWLRAWIRWAATAYYQGDADVVPDSEFDRAVGRLRRLAPDAPELTTTGWGYVPGMVAPKPEPLQ